MKNSTHTESQQDFIEKALNVNLVDKTSPELLNLREKILKALQKIDIGCDFKEGLCVHQRLSNGEHCGCQNCGEKIGYYKSIPSSWAVKLSKLWDKDKGFLGPEGCKIPFERRSSTCVYHRCDDKHLNKLKETEEALLLTVKNVIII